MDVDYDLTLSIMKLARKERYILTNTENKISPSGCAVLMELAEKDGVTATNIANTMGFEKSFVTHILKELSAEDYITITKTDGRTDNITITDKGKVAAVETEKNLKPFVDTLFKNCTVAEKKMFMENIEKATYN